MQKVKMFFRIYNTILGKIRISADERNITELNFLLQNNVAENSVEQETDLIKESFRQLSEYLKGQRKIFNLPLAPCGTDFQRKVWRELQKIPYGETRSYKQIAEAMGNSKACRAVGSANRENPIAIIIPCHRVISANGKLGGYSCGLDRKKFLLELEHGTNSKQSPC